MSRRELKKFLLTWSILMGVSLTLLAIPSSKEIIFSFNEVFAQNQTVANQTASTAGQNQTVANITRQEFQPLEDILSEARTALQTNNIAAAYNALSSAQNQIFDLTHVTGENREQPELAKAKVLEEQLKPVRDSINQAREAIWNNNTMSALNTIGSGEVSLLRITTTLPPGEEVTPPPGEEEEEEEGEEEGEE